MMGTKNKLPCAYPSEFKVSGKFGYATMRFFGLSQKDLLQKCRDCFYKKRETCSGAYTTAGQDNKNKLSNITNYDKRIKKRQMPVEISFEVTHKCNFSCDFCFNQNSFKNNIKELSTSQIFKIIDNITKEGITTIRFTGGEPFLRKDILKILEYAKAKGLYTKVNTNLIFSNQYIKKLKNYVDCLYLSFNPSEKYNNMQEDKEFGRKIDFIRNLVKNNFKFRLNTVSTKHNIRKLKDLSKIVNSFDCGWTMLRPVPTKNQKMQINNGDVKILIESLIDINKKFNKKYIITALPFCSYNPKKVKQVSIGSKRCGAFFSLSVNPSGRINICYSINKDLGNAFKAGLIDAWKAKFSANIRELTSLPETCKECSYVNECLGGCRFAAKLVNGSYSSLDPLAMPKNHYNSF